MLNTLYAEYLPPFNPARSDRLEASRTRKLNGKDQEAKSTKSGKVVEQKGSFPASKSGIGTMRTEQSHEVSRTPHSDQPSKAEDEVVTGQCAK